MAFVKQWAEADAPTCTACLKQPGTWRNTKNDAALCKDCADGGYPPRTELFPPAGIYGVTDPAQLKHRGGGPSTPPSPGPPLPPGRPYPTPPGTPPAGQEP